MSKAIIILGMQFGDEAKGSCVDYLCDLHKASLVVKFCGGHQCCHNVVLEGGRHHAFAQFGSGTFLGVPTYLGPAFICEPLALKKEAEVLEKTIDDKILYGKSLLEYITVDNQSLVTTPFHKALNQIQELSRQKKHGSCGVGIGSTREYWLAYGKDALVWGDLVSKRASLEKLRLLQQRMILKCQLYVNTIETKRIMEFLYDFNIVKYYGQILEIAQQTNPNDAHIFNLRNPSVGNPTIIFEGSQGVLLDENFGFHPHTTWSTTTDHHAKEIISDWGISDVETIGVLRTYMTRHGNGPLPTEQIGKTLAKNELNASGVWTGQMRYGYFDMNLVKYSLEIQPVDSIFLTHTDEDPRQVCLEYMKVDGQDVKLEPQLNLEKQEKLTEKLFRVLPKEFVVSSASDMLSTLKNISFISQGPKRKDKVQV